MKKTRLVGRYINAVALRWVKSSRVKYILIFIVATLFLSTYFTNINQEISFGRTNEIRFSDSSINVSLYPSIRVPSPSPKNVFFLKVHKSASSTIQNILMRYGRKHGLNFVLPYTSNYLGHPAPFEASMALPVSASSVYNIFCHHTRFDHESARGILPADAIFLTILRDPADLFESLYSYFDLEKFYRMNLTAFVRMPRWWLHTCHRYFGRIGLNQMAFDLGMDDSDFSDFVEIRAFLRDISSQFHLVMLAEYFEESLVLLKHSLELDWEDVVYFAHNQRLDSAKIRLGKEDRKLISEANHVDRLIYDHFSALFREKLAHFGEPRMREEVAKLREVIARARDRCGVQEVDNGRGDLEVIFRDFSQKVKAIRVTESGEEFCQNLAKSEMPFTSQLRDEHVRRHGSAWLNFLYFIRYHRL